MQTIPSVSVSRFGTAFAGLILVTLLSASWPAATAAPVSSKQAAAVVTGWLSVDRTPLGETLGGTVQRVDTFNDQRGNPVYYVVYLHPFGFVIVAADDLVEPIVGFARAGKFDPSEDNPLGALVSKDLPARVAHARQSGAVSSDKGALQARAKWRRLGGEDGGPAPNGPTPEGIVSVSDVRIAPLTQTTWDQQTAADAGTACYNYYTPPYGAGNPTNYPAGCVATAMAQLLRYYQFPTTGVGTAEFEIYNNGSAQWYTLLGGDGQGGPYVWSNMPLVPPSNPTTTQCEAIGALTADAGATVNMSYAAGGSESDLTDAGTALTGTFHFSSTIRGRNNYGTDISAYLVGMINPNLDAHYPVLLGIETSSDVGHAVVADGYGYSASTLYTHLNLGWSGASTAWYDLPLIDTTDYTFTIISGCVYNAYTNGSGEIISGRVLDQIGRPVTNATVKAIGGGTYTTTTDTNGIYALARIPSATSYAITITRTNYTSVSTNVSTGTSSDQTTTCGNQWGVNLTMNMLTTVIDHLVWGALASTQSLNTPFGVTITAQNLTNGPVAGFTGPVALSAYATGLGSSSTVIGSLSSGYYVYGSEMTLGYAFTPNTNVQVTAVRGYSTDNVSIWTGSGTLLTSQAVSASGSWVEAALATPITLTGGTTYRVASHLPAGMHGYYLPSSWPTTFANGTVGQNFYYSYGDVFPTTVYGTGEGPLVDLRYSVAFSNSIAVSPTSSGSFVNGVWSGNLTVSQSTTNIVLKADDGAGHTALSTPFNVITPFQLLSPHRLAGGQFQFTVFSTPGQHLQILASSNLLSWTTNATLTNNTGTTNFTDSTTGLSKRFYRARQSP
ncbi:MAG: C10 family peptidase [Verrucomicrobiota bacterium]|jgi:hypothetical protein